MGFNSAFKGLNMVLDTHIMEFIDLFHCIQFMIFQKFVFLFQVLVSSCSGNVNLEHGEKCVCVCV